MARIALLGGSFDPPTRGHGATARTILQSGLVDELWFVPAGDDRYDRPVVATADDRRVMVEGFITDEFPGDKRVKLEPAQLEGRLPGSATIDLVDYLKLQEPGHTFFFVIGADNIGKITGWKEYDRLSRTVRFLAVPRLGDSIPLVIPPVVTVIDGGEHSSASSSEVRRLLAAGESADRLLTPHVSKYIAEKSLYRSPARG